MSGSQAHRRLDSMKSNILIHTELSQERMNTVYNAYEGLQSAGAGSVELGYVQELAKLVNPDVELNRVISQLPWLDNSNSYSVSLFEFGEAMKVISASMADEEIEAAIQSALHGDGNLLAAVRKVTGERITKVEGAEEPCVAPEAALNVDIPGEKGTKSASQSPDRAPAGSASPLEEPIPHANATPELVAESVADSDAPASAAGLTPDAGGGVAEAAGKAATEEANEEAAAVVAERSFADEGADAESSKIAAENEDGDREVPAGATEPPVASREEPIEAAEPYFHPSGCRVYLEEEVVPTLREGLVELLAKVEEDRFVMAAGKPWDVEDGKRFLPRGWQPFSPHRWLAEWILARLPPLPVDPSTAGFIGSGREQQAAVVFSILESSQAAPPSASHISEFTLRMDVGGEEECAAMMEAAGIVPGAEAVTLEQLTVLLLNLGQNVGDHLFELSLLRALSGSLGNVSAAGIAVLSFCKHSRTSRFVLLYLVLLLSQEKQPSLQPGPSAAAKATEDGEEGGVEAGGDAAAASTPGTVFLAVEALEQIFRSLSKAKKHEALAIVGEEVAGQVTDAEFVNAMELAYGGVSEENGALDQLVYNLIEKPTRNTAALLEVAVMEIEPEELQEKIQSFDTFPLVGHVGFSELEDIRNRNMPPLLLLDVRSKAEMDISYIPGALHAPVLKDDSSPEMKWYLPDEEVEKVREVVLHVEATNGVPPIVVSYCAIGPRGSCAALQLTEQLGLPVSNLCGGIINYYNQGGTVHTPEGKAVQSIHPGGPGSVDFVIRPNGFKLPT